MYSARYGNGSEQMNRNESSTEKQLSQRNTSGKSNATDFQIQKKAESRRTFVWKILLYVEVLLVHKNCWNVRFFTNKNSLRTIRNETQATSRFRRNHEYVFKVAQFLFPSTQNTIVHRTETKTQIEPFFFCTTSFQACVLPNRQYY